MEWTDSGKSREKVKEKYNAIRERKRKRTARKMDKKSKVNLLILKRSYKVIFLLLLHFCWGGYSNKRYIMPHYCCKYHFISKFKTESKNFKQKSTKNTAFYTIYCA
jgi:hypothetical protein